MYFCGAEPSKSNKTESWNGSSWTELAETNQVKTKVAGFGTQTSGMVAGGLVPPQTANAETWNGTAWTEVGNLNTGRSNLAGAGFSNSYGIVFGGDAPPDPQDTVEQWNGSSWTEVADLATARKNLSGAGSGVAALCIGGENPGGNLANVEEWTNPFETKTIGTD